MKTQTIPLNCGQEGVTLTAYLLDDSPELLNGSPRPAVVICPGGAYTFCSDREAEPVALRFCGIGYHAFILRYSTINGRENFWPKDVSKLPEADPDTVFPNPILQLGKAVLMIRERAAEWSVDTEQIGICGFSAGGHNCAMYSCYWNQPLLTEALHVPAEQLKPSFCILGYPFISFSYNHAYSFDAYTKAAYRWMDLDYFGTPDPSEQDIAKADADRHVTEDNPPTFIWNTSTDAGVPPLHTLKYASALAAKKVPFELHMFGEGQHGLVFADPSTAGDKSQINGTVRAWFPLAQQWLEKNVPLPIEK